MPAIGEPFGGVASGELIYIYVYMYYGGVASSGSCFVFDNKFQGCVMQGGHPYKADAKLVLNDINGNMSVYLQIMDQVLSKPNMLPEDTCEALHRINNEIDTQGSDTPTKEQREVLEAAVGALASQ